MRDAKVDKRPGLQAARSLTIKDCAKLYNDDLKAGWRNAKHAAQWTSIYCYLN